MHITYSFYFYRILLPFSSDRMYLYSVHVPNIDYTFCFHHWIYCFVRLIHLTVNKSNNLLFYDGLCISYHTICCFNVFDMFFFASFFPSFWICNSIINICFVIIIIIFKLFFFIFCIC